MPGTLDAKLLNECVEGCAQSHQLLLVSVDALTAQQFSEPSRLHGWTRAHIIGHLAMNAQSHVHLIACAMRGEHGQQYPGGAAQRNNDIEIASSWPHEKLVTSLRKAIYLLEGAWAGATLDAWQATATVASGASVPIHELVFNRWRETVVHLTDMNIGHEYTQWPPTYVRLELERQKMAWAASHSMGMTLLPQKVMELSEARRVAWLLQREDVEGLPLGPGL